MRGKRERNEGGVVIISNYYLLKSHNNWDLLNWKASLVRVSFATNWNVHWQSSSQKLIQKRNIASGMHKYSFMMNATQFITLAKHRKRFFGKLLITFGGIHHHELFSQSIKIWSQFCLDEREKSNFFSFVSIFSRCWTINGSNCC